MDVAKIQELSELYSALKEFRGECINSSVTLTAVSDQAFNSLALGQVVLQPRAAKYILPALRAALSIEIVKLEQAIVLETYQYPL